MGLAENEELVLSFGIREGQRARLVAYLDPSKDRRTVTWKHNRPHGPEGGPLDELVVTDTPGSQRYDCFWTAPNAPQNSRDHLQYVTLITRPKATGMDEAAPDADQAGANQTHEHRTIYLGGCTIRISVRYPECFIVQHVVARRPDGTVIQNIEEDSTRNILKLLALPHGLTRGRNVHSQARRMYLGDSVSAFGYAHPLLGYTITLGADGGL